MTRDLDKPALVRDRFSWDNPEEAPDTVFEGWHDPTSRWNGWATPAFEKAEADRIMAWNNDNDALAPSGEYQTITFDEARDTYFLLDPGDPDGQEAIEGFDAICRDEDDLGVVRHLYGIGSWAWTWSEVGDEPQAATSAVTNHGLDMHAEDKQIMFGLPPRSLADAQRWLEATLDTLGYRFEDKRSEAEQAASLQPDHDNLQLITGFHWDTDGRDYRDPFGQPTFTSDQADAFDANRAIAFERINATRGDAYAFEAALRPCNHCNHLCYYSEPTSWYHHLNPEHGPCFLTSEDPAVPSEELADIAEPSSIAFVKLAQMERLVRRWYAEDCIPDEAMAEAERILQGAQA